MNRQIDRQRERYIDRLDQIRLDLTRLDQTRLDRQIDRDREID